MSNSPINKLNQTIEQGLYSDPKTVEAIKENTNKLEGLQQASKQFETLFLQMVLKSMRSAGDAMSDEDSIVSSKQTRMYRDMHDSQLTMAMANTGNIGIADAMVKQLSPLVSSAVETAAKPANVAAIKTEKVTGENKINSADEFKSSPQLVADKTISQSAFSQPLLTINALKIKK